MKAFFGEDALRDAFLCRYKNREEVCVIFSVPGKTMSGAAIALAEQINRDCNKKSVKQ